jgi:hypothetical protein
MSRSEIFDAFVKIAQEKGMISNDSSDSKKKLEQTGRADSLDISAIEALYGVKPNTPKGSDYKDNIMEAAHPNSVVVAPSYDKLNGLVENNIERQNIILHIVQKTPDGLQTQRKYAEQELLLSLVRIGNDLDNRDEDQLRVLADSCLLQLKKNSEGFKKEAIGPLAIALIAAAVIGAIYAHQHLADANHGMMQATQNLQSTLSKFASSSVDWGVGHEYDQDLKSDVQGLKDRIDLFSQTYQSLEAIIRELERPKDATELKQIAAQPESQQVVAAYNKLYELITNMSAYMDKIETDFKSEFYKTRHTKDTGVLTKGLEWAHLEGGTTSLFADPFQDVMNAIPPFKENVKSLLDMLKEAKSREAKARAELLAAQSKAKEEYGSGATTSWDDKSHEKEPESHVRKLEEDLKGLIPAGMR